MIRAQLYVGPHMSPGMVYGNLRTKKNKNAQKIIKSVNFRVVVLNCT